MKIIDAVWEKRNLGLEVIEIELEPDDCQKHVVDQLSKLPLVDYVSVKVPVGRLSLCGELEDAGFRFREMLSTVEVDSLPELSGVMARYSKHLSSICATEHRKQEVFSHIRKGMFVTDRFSLDQKFTTAQAANRYCGMISDSIERGAELYAIEFKKEFVGFFLVKPDLSGVYDSLLAGIFPDFQRLALGSFINHMAYVHCFAAGARAVSTTFSSNNLGAVNIHANLKTRLTSQCYVFSKHLK